MKTLKVCILWDANFIQDTVFFHLLKQLSKKKIAITNFDNADLVIFGPYDLFTVKRRIYEFFLRKFQFTRTNSFFSNLDMYSFKRKYGPLRVFINMENIRHDLIESDFYWTPDLGVHDQNHLRYPSWKDYIDWSKEGIFRPVNTLNSHRFGFYWNMNDLLKPLNISFLEKPRKFCLFAGHMKEPRRSMYLQFKKHFEIDGYGLSFNKKIKNHNLSDFKTYDIMKNYAFNLCPHNSLFHGYYNESIINAILANTLPITWADQNIKVDFNPNAFVNLIDDVENNYENICNKLKDDNFLKQYTKEPILLKKLDLNVEKVFIEKILSCL